MLIASLILPALATLTAYWGSTWGWNADGKLAGESLAYVGVSFAFLFGVILVAYELRNRLDPARRRISSRPGLLLAAWGVYVITVSASLIQVFDADALWFGSLGLVYLGLIAAIFGVIRALAG